MADKNDPSDAGALRPITPPPELIADLLRTFNEEEVAEEIRELRSGGGRTLDQFIGGVEAAAQ